MVFFITFLRAIAACLITNSHYEGIYPTDILANGGLLGDIIFFAISGYCLCKIKENFPKWYGKRLLRCYLPVVIATTVYLLIGLYKFSMHNIIWWYVYPTYYHFIASIVVLYIPYYVIMKIDFLRRNIPYIMGILAAVAVLVFVIFYDKSYYHIDTVREPMILFLYMESMLLGALFKEKGETMLNRFSWWHVFGLIATATLYFASKLAFSMGILPNSLQILNWLAIFALLFFILRLCAGLDGKLENYPKWLKKVISFLAERTLEIYVVQYALIPIIGKIGKFPINWILTTAAILIAAEILHIICSPILKLTKGKK